MSLTMKEMVKEVQRMLKTRPDGDPGRHTWSCFYLSVVPKERIKFPYSIKAFGNWLHITDPELVKPFHAKGENVSSFKNVVSGSFSYNGLPISIMVSDGKVIHPHSCHLWNDGHGYPESVLYYTYDGKHGIKQCRTAKDLPKNVKWAIGGAGMIGDNAKEEGFIGRYADVFRRTSHMLIGFDKYGYFNAIEVRYQNKSQMIAHMQKLGIEEYILLDGGHITASNIDGHRYNLYTKQQYLIGLGG